MQRTTVAEVKRLLAEKTTIDPQYQQLIYLSKYMQDEKTLADYNIQNGSNLFLVMRLPGGSSLVLKRRIDASIPLSDEECVITMESTKETGVIVLRMPCGHSIFPDGLMDYSWAEVSTNKRIEIKCPPCATEWDIGIIRRYGGTTAIELSQLELGISKNFCSRSNDINQCPKCNSYITRKNASVNSVVCIVCSRKSQSSWYFCWYCLQEWKKPLSSATCGNANCNSAESLAQLRDCGKVKVDFIEIEIPKLRSCPKCGTIIELTSGCKHMTCKACKTEFCFVCLRRRTQGSWPCGSYNTKCAEAPRQTVIPKP